MIHPILLVLLVCLSTTAQSPHADLIGELFNPKISLHVSDNVLEDAKLDVPGLIHKYGYPLEVHDVTTPDGYILQIHRIPYGRNHNNKLKDRPVVFLMHGILCSSADWVLMGPDYGLAYILADKGFDVWMGNARGNFYSRKHINLNPDALLGTDFWKFSWDEIGNHDLPTMIDHILETTSRRKLHYIGHSQGTTAFFVMAALRPEYNKKITTMNAYAPVAYMAHNKNLLLKFLAPFSRQLGKIAALIGVGEFMPKSAIKISAGYSKCIEEVAFKPICNNILFLIGGWNQSVNNDTMLPLKLAHTPAGAAARQLVHYGQGIAHGDFRRYDLGKRLNKKVYGTKQPPKYDLSRVTAPVYLHYSDNDPMADVNDVDRLFRELRNPVAKFRISDGGFSHLDFLWGISAQELLFRRTLDVLNSNGDKSIMT